MRRITVAQVGMGSRAESYWQAIITRFRETTRLVAICDTNPARIERVRRAAGAEGVEVAAYSGEEFERMLAKHRVDLVVVTSKDSTHDLYITAALAAGADDSRFLRGRVIHRLLQTLPEIAPARRGAACDRLLARIAPALTSAARDAIAGEVLAVLDDPQLRDLFAPGSRAEAPLIGVIGDLVVSGQVDRLVVGDEQVMVIDYKTNRPPPRDEADVAPIYVAQMAAYKAVLSQIYPGKSILCALLWTDGPRLMALRDEIIDRYAP